MIPKNIKASGFFSPLIVLLYICSVVFAGVAIEARDATIMKTAQDFIQWLHSHHTVVGAKSICFYSGNASIKGVAVPVWKHVQEFASDKGCQTIDNLIKLSHTNTTGWNTDPEWMEASIALAGAVLKEPTYSLLGTNVSLASVWLRGELPTLVKNPSVKTVQIWELTNIKEYNNVQNLIRPSS